jgi:hypothetical protein
MSRKGLGLNLRSREEFLEYAKKYVTGFLKEQGEAGRPVSIRYVREWYCHTGEFRTVVRRDGSERIVPVIDKGSPYAVMVAYRDGDGTLRFGWSSRSNERDEGTIIYRRGRYAGKVREFSKSVEKKTFSRIEGLFRSIRRAQSGASGCDVKQVPTHLFSEASDFRQGVLDKKVWNITAGSEQTATA